MNLVQASCSVCGQQFAPQSSYQVEERTVRGERGEFVVHKVHFCSRKCLEQSLLGQEAPPPAQCTACGREFHVELVSQVIFLRGKRQYACSSACRAVLIEPSRYRSLADGIAAEASRSLPADPEEPSDGFSALAPTKAPAPTQPPPARPSPRTVAPAQVVPLMTTPANSQAPVAWRRIEAELAGAPKTLAIFNHKGGTGKTTTAVTLAYGLAARGRRVLLVDTDGQGNVAVSFGLKPTRTLYHVLVLGQSYDQAVLQARPGLDVLPSNETLAAAELYLAGRQQRDRVLATRLAAAKNDYDHVIVDCSPSLSLMSQNALVFADAVLCPVACDYLSLIGVRQVLRTIKQVNRHLNHPVRLWGVLPTMFDSRALVCREALDTMRQHFGSRCLAPVRNTIRVKEAPAQGQTILEYAPSSSASSDYTQVIERLVQGEPEQPLQRAGGVA